MSAASGASRAERIADDVRDLAERAARRSDCELADVRFVQDRGAWKLRVFIDREEGVDVEDCAAVSRELSALLDVEDPISHPYHLEVSSPGLDRSLLVAEDYRRHAGQRVRIRTDTEIDGRRLFHGKLRGLREGTVLVEESEDEAIRIPLKRVSEASLEIEI